MKKLSTRSLGRQGEDLAVQFLERKGYQILERNYNTPFGEIDLIALWNTPQEAKRLVFVEVKMRRTQEFGYPEQSVTAKKLRHLILACQDYLQEHPMEDAEWQIDVLSIEMGIRTKITHLENITVSLDPFIGDQ
ncbi:MAG: YraN family protein [Anaerolineae bacterium]|jgi:putative endonuclease|nr:MAG: YraN family protein [Anaerolineae bacterium]